jgi:hypothetical protein
VPMSMSTVLRNMSTKYYKYVANEKNILNTVDILIGTKCPPLLTGLFLYSYEASFIQGLLKKKKRTF